MNFRQSYLLLQLTMCGFVLFFAGCNKKPVPPPPPGIVKYDFSYSGSSYLGGSLYFQSTAPSGAKLSWDLGDSTSTIATSPVHQYNNAGVYTVTLVVNDDIANKIVKNVAIGFDSLLMQDIKNRRSWSRNYYEYVPNSGHASIPLYTYADTDIEVKVIDPATIVFETDTLKYSVFYSSISPTTNDTVVCFYQEYAYPDQPQRETNYFFVHKLTHEIQYHRVHLFIRGTVYAGATIFNAK